MTIKDQVHQAISVMQHGNMWLAVNEDGSLLCEAPSRKGLMIKAAYYLKLVCLCGEEDKRTKKFRLKERE